MPNNTHNNHHRNGRLAFLQEFFRNPAQIGSVIPSSRFLERRIVEAADVASAGFIVELGPGTGGTTRAILDAMPNSARLLTIEINPHFHTMLDSIDDERLITHLGSACDISQVLELYNLPSPNAVISGIPFSTMSHRLGSGIIEAVSRSLAPEGRFVAYQARSRVATLCRPIMGSEQTATELFNIPPMRIYQWEKQDLHTGQD